MNGGWSSRARVFVTPWAVRDDHVPSLLPCLVAFGGLWCSIAAGNIPTAHASSPVVLSSDESSCFLVFSCT
jgi:hypothetical protein